MKKGEETMTNTMKQELAQLEVTIALSWPKIFANKTKELDAKFPTGHLGEENFLVASEKCE